MDNAAKNKRPENPSKRANWLSLITFWYTIPTFVLGYTRKLSIETLYETMPEHKSSHLGDLIEAKWKRELLRATIAKRKPSLARVLLQMFGVSYFSHGMITAIYELFVKVVQPLALGQLIAYYSHNKSEICLAEAYIYASIIIICALLGAILKNPNVQATAVLSMKAKIACSSLIYRKTLKLNKAAIDIAGGGQIMNLLSNDISKFDNFVVLANYLWITPIQTIIVAYFMYREVGISSIIGVTTLLLFVPYMFFLGKQLSVYRLDTAKKTDIRINLMNEIINGVEAIKMFAWEKQFINLVDGARRDEIKSVTKASYINGTIAALNLSLNHIALYVTIVAYALIYHSFNAQQVFVLSLYYNILKLSVAMSFGYGISAAAAFKVSIKRLNQFMELEENQELYPFDSQITTTQFIPNKNYAITLLHGTVKWLKSSTENTLTNINLKIKQGDLVAVVGSVGSGKSSLLYTILKELTLISGDLITNGTISYASQDSWIFPTSVRQNILFGLPMKSSRYKKVLKCCSLKRDLDIFPYGDKTIIGERGVTLSGGQRARINLARAVYKDADIYLLDDPLSAVDAHVGKQLFEECISSFLKSKTVILVTHQLQYLKNMDNIVWLENGKIKGEGRCSSLQKSSMEFDNLLEVEEHSLNMDRILVDQDILEKFAISVSSVDEDKIEEPKECAELLKRGSLSNDLYRIYFSVSSNCCLISCTVMFFVTASCLSSLSAYFLAYWVNSIQKMDEQIEMHGNVTNFVNSTYSNFNMNIYIYSGLTGATIIISVLRSWSFYNMCMRSSIKLHDNLFRSVIRATMTFFNINTSGRILNRFSKDIGDIDELLPDNILFFLDVGCVIIGSIVLIILVNPWLIIPSAIFCLTLHIARSVYLVTSTDIKRLEGITKSPVFTYLNVSLQGLSTIRAFNVQAILEKEFDNHQDLHSSTLHAFISTERALSYFVDLLCAVYIGIVIISFFVLEDEKYGGNVGLAVSLVVGLTNGLQYCVRQSTQIDNQMTAVERVLEYTSIEHEAALESNPNEKPSKSWPSKGKIVFSKLYLRYLPDEGNVLRNLNFTVEPLEKIGIVGRTGAGKSSVISALFRLAQTSGSIIIDDIDIHTIGLHDLRSKISIIPQQPVFLSGSLRRNLDPFEEYEDEVLWKALEDVEMKELIASLPLGLYIYILDGGSNFSVGQRQLICLARAIIRNNKILVLDEATANIDLKTDELIQKTIKRKFSSCTVLTIAHRLNTVMDSDKIMVLDAGRIVEFNHPYLLLQKSDGFFYNMVQQTGPHTAKTLMELAKQNYRVVQPIEDLILL